MFYHFVNDNPYPEECERKRVKKCPHGEHYEDYFVISKMVEERLAAKDNKRHRLGSKHVTKYNQEGYMVTVPVDASDEEKREVLFHLDVYRQKYGTRRPILSKTEDEYVTYYFEGSFSASGRGWNTLIFPNVTWVEDMEDDGHSIIVQE